MFQGLEGGGSRHSGEQTQHILGEQRLGHQLWEGAAGPRKLTLVATQGGSHTGTIARGPGVAGTALKGRVEIVNGFL